MRFEFKLPDLAEGMIEGELVDWLVAAGDVVKAEQPIAEVMTDKATVVIPSPVAGKVLELPWAAGDIVPVGQTLVTFEIEGQAPTQRHHAGHVVPTEDAPAPAAKADVAKAEVAASAVAAPVEEAEFVPVARGSRALASPATRRLARELGIDIGLVTGSGPGGRVSSEDVEAFAAGKQSKVEPVKAAPAVKVEAPKAEAKPAAAPSLPVRRVTIEQDQADERQKIRGLRRAIYEAMARSKSTAAHFTYVEEIDCEALIASHKRIAKAAEAHGVKLTYLAFIAKAVLLTLPRFPKMNAQVDDATQEVVYKKALHLGIAAATDPGLVVPVIRDAGQMSILELASRIQDLGNRARTNTLRPDELKGSTFTISSLGKLGGLFATPIINHPEVAIMGIHQMQKRAVVLTDKDGKDTIVARQRMNISLSFDHRLIDGHEGAAFAQEVKRYLETPDLMLLETI